LCAHDLGRAHVAQGEWEEAASELTRAITLRDHHGDGVGAAGSRVYLARVRLAQADLQGATELLRKAVHALRRLKQNDAQWAVIESGAALACARGRYEDAARLYAVAIPQRDALWDTIDPSEYARRDADLAAIRAALGEKMHVAIFALGSVITLGEALDLLAELFGT
jgi:tetratricopeptide (TPR) repeat protein